MDTSALISAHLSPRSVHREAYDLAWNKGIVVFSKATFHEFALTFAKEKFERYQPLEERLKIISLVELRSQLFEVSIKLNVCLDPMDDMFLELAITSGASAIITRDPDLLVLHPFENIPILSPADFLMLF